MTNLELLPTVPANASAKLPAEARYVDFYKTNRRSRFGIRPASLFVFEVLGQSGFLIEDGQDYPHLACGRCGGYGEYSYNQIDGTVCYGCNGDGLGRAITWDDALRIAKRRIADAKREARRMMNELHEQALTWNAFYADHADVIAYLADKDDRRGFIGDMARKTATLNALSPRMVEAIRRIISEDAAKVAKVNAAGHFGSEGERIKGITAAVKSVKFVDNDFGGSWLVVMETSEGHVLKTFASGAFADVKEGEEVTFSATVKRHSEYAGKKETLLSRCMIPKKK